MTITERNNNSTIFAKNLIKSVWRLAWIETEIMAVNAIYDRFENRDTPLSHDEMFGG